MKDIYSADANILCKEDVTRGDMRFAILHVTDRNGVYAKLHVFNTSLIEMIQEDQEYRVVFRNNLKNGRVYHNVVGASKK